MKQGNLVLKIIVGNVFIALAVNLFILPHHLISGGSTGLVLTLQHFFSLDFAILTAIINVVTFALGFICLGKKFALTTLVSTFIYPVIVSLTTPLTSTMALTTEPLVASVFAGLLMGLGLGLVIGAGASTGGMDIPIIIINKKTGLSISVAMYLMDSCILISQMLFNPFENLFYGLVLIAATTLTINQTIMLGKSEYQVFAFSNQIEKIRDTITQELDRGATLVHIETGYEKKDTKALLCVTSSRDLHMIQKTILNIDPLAFITVSKVQEVSGRGFSIDKHYK